MICSCVVSGSTRWPDVVTGVAWCFAPTTTLPPTTAAPPAEPWCRSTDLAPVDGLREPARGLRARTGLRARDRPRGLRASRRRPRQPPRPRSRTSNPTPTREPLETSNPSRLRTARDFEPDADSEPLETSNPTPTQNHSRLRTRRRLRTTRDFESRRRLRATRRTSNPTPTQNHSGLRTRRRLRATRDFESRRRLRAHRDFEPDADSEPTRRLRTRRRLQCPTGLRVPTPTRSRWHAPLRERGTGLRDAASTASATPPRVCESSISWLPSERDENDGARRNEQPERAPAMRRRRTHARAERNGRRAAGVAPAEMVLRLGRPLVRHERLQTRLAIRAPPQLELRQLLGAFAVAGRASASKTHSRPSSPAPGVIASSGVYVFMRYPASGATGTGVVHPAPPARRRRAPRAVEADSGRRSSRSSRWEWRPGGRRPPRARSGWRRDAKRRAIRSLPCGSLRRPPDEPAPAEAGDPLRVRAGPARRPACARVRPRAARRGARDSGARQATRMPNL